MVLPVVDKGEIVVAGIQPEDQEGGDAGRHYEPTMPQIASAKVMMTKIGVLISLLGSA
jgi:hypothetical protein